MNRRPLKLLVLLTALYYACFPSSGIAVVYYKNDFESGAVPTHHPNVDPGQIWTLAPTLPDVYGPKNHFNLSTSNVHNGDFSLRFTYEARNGICNTCGSRFVTHIETGHDGVDYFIANDGADLSLADNPDTDKKDDGPKAEPGKIVYNRNGGYSKWEITSVSSELAKNDRVNMKLVSEGINGESTINSGDSMAITRHCGIDGIIGVKKGENDIYRRSDCNSVIMWFAYVTPQQPGESIFRRAYLKAEVTSPNIIQKLHYLRPNRNGPLSGEIVLLGSSTVAPNNEGFKIIPKLTGTYKYGSTSPIYVPGDGLPDTLQFERGTWYYIEEEYLAATAKTIDKNGVTTEYNNDGTYRLWWAKSGEEPIDASSPTFEITGLALPPIDGGKGTHISFWGNTPHWKHIRGSWYIDDVIVSDTWNGPVPSTGKDKLPPKPAKTN